MTRKFHQPSKPENPESVHAYVVSLRLNTYDLKAMNELIDRTKRDASSIMRTAIRQYVDAELLRLADADVAVPA